MSTEAAPTPDDGIVLADEAATESAGRAFGRGLGQTLGHALGQGLEAEFGATIEAAPTRALSRLPAAPHPHPDIGERHGSGGPQPSAGALIVGLAGGLGAGKTTLARAVLRALGVTGTVRSPTYTIAEPYDTRIGRIWHLDLYRIVDPDELEFIAIRDLVSDSAVCLVEWPERGRGGMPEPDCLVTLAVDGAGSARRLRIAPRTPRGDGLALRVFTCMQPDSREPG